jgi:multidrug efflux pump subunit AcrA (membrane-fusion protein)
VRPQVVAAADDPDALSAYVGASTRLVIDVAATGGEVLVVPVAALTVGGDGTTRVEVERAPVTATDDGSTELVTVEVGLTADGLVEIRSDALVVGDRVVVGQAAAATAPASTA